LDDLRPHILRTHDGGKTWKEIVKGLPDGAVVNAVREDPIRKGLLFCGTERAVYFSIDDGENWQPLRLNMPATSIRDLVIHDDDLVVGTHGRSFWILDDVTPLRQIGASTGKSVLFTPQMATRVKRSVHTDTPFPPEEPAGQNPPDGAIINYYLNAPSKTPIVLEISDSAGKLVRRFASDDKPLDVDINTLRFPSYWIKPFQQLKNERGMQRFVWDLTYPNPPAEYDLPISAVYKDTPFVPQGPAVMPGTYTLKLVVDGVSFTQPLTVRMDPRIKTPRLGLQSQFDLSMNAYRGVQRTAEMSKAVTELSSQLSSAATDAQKAKLDEIRQKIKLLTDGPPQKPGTAMALTDLPLNRLRGAFGSMLDLLQDADVTPSTQAAAASNDLQIALSKAEAVWKEVQAMPR